MDAGETGASGGSEKIGRVEGRGGRAVGLFVTIVVTLAVSWGAFVWLFGVRDRYWANRHYIGQAEAAYILTNVASEIRLGNAEAALKLCDNEIGLLAKTAGNLRKFEGADTDRADSFLRSVKTYDGVSHVLPPAAREGLRDVPGLTEDEILTVKCEAGICRLVRRERGEGAAGH